REINFGIFTGLTYESLVEKYPKESKQWFDDPHNYDLQDGENINMVYKRVLNFLDYDMDKDEDIVLVTHERIIRLICSWVFDDPTLFFKFKANNGSISIVTVDGDYKFIKKLNSSVL